MTKIDHHRSTVPKECPNCGLLNSPEALRCDCGYDFAAHRMEESYLSAQDQEKRKGPYILRAASVVATVVATVLLLCYVFLLFVQPEAAYWVHWFFGPVLIVLLLLALVGAMSAFIFWIVDLRRKKPRDDTGK